MVSMPIVDGPRCTAVSRLIVSSHGLEWGMATMREKWGHLTEFKNVCILTPALVGHDHQPIRGWQQFLLGFGHLS
jgi:hypothetical protein